ncbi:SDR family NAD(P)-dependent oxidoreductase [Oceanibium sediminis]|uniref:SDR family NAD(P)-dependent oxidoreductase n=1 Tax=Oceanibium sediminis TaxID=2026339 RepID=UPI000DD30868|nr:SDR family NAD(P)-dependent oxidoreductase [Oceanibium sediminis]
MTRQQSDRRAVVTGAARGIGAATVRRLAHDGARVLIADIDAGPARAVAEEIRAEGHEALWHQVDIADEASVASLAARVGEVWGGLDVLVNNASILDGTPLDELTRARFTTVQQVNQDGALWVSMALRPWLARSASPRIVNLSSILGMRGQVDGLAYSVAKGGVINMTRSLAVELAPEGIVVNCICPGFIDTRMAQLPDGSGHEHETDWFRDIYLKYGRLPLRRAGQPEDVADAIAFFCGEDCRYVTGQVLLVDGGLSVTF